MGDAPTEPDQRAKEVWAFVVGELDKYKSKEPVVAQLVEAGWPLHQAAEYVENAKRAIDAYERQTPHRFIEKDPAEATRWYARHMVIGCLVAAGGALFAGISYLAASSSPEGGYYIVPFGAVAWGIGQFLYGLHGWRATARYRRHLG